MADTGVLAGSNVASIVLTAIVTAALTIYFMSGGTAPGGPSAGGLGSLIKDTLVYIPHALLLYGVIADMLTYEGVYSIASLVGVLSLIVHVLFKFIWSGTFEVIEKVIEAINRRQDAAAQGIRKSPITSTGSTQTFGGAAPGSFFGSYTGCDLQGMPSWSKSPYAPQTLVIIATIFSYYGFDSVNNRGWANSTATILLGSVFYIAQLVLMGDCYDSITPSELKPGESMPRKVSKWVQAFLGAIEGMFMGGVSYSVVQAYYPDRLPSSLISPFPRMTPNMLRDGKFDKDGNPWVCVNGVCYPDMSSTESRKAFADMVAESTGSGSAAVAEDCPAN